MWYTVLYQKKGIKMKRLDKKKDEIIMFFNAGVSIRRLARNYECASNTMKKHLIKWEVIK